MGMFSEAYMIFAIGNIKPFLAIDRKSCIPPLTSALLTFSELDIIYGTEYAK